MQDGGHHRVAEKVATRLEVWKGREKFHLGGNGGESEVDELASEVLGVNWLAQEPRASCDFPAFGVLWVQHGEGLSQVLAVFGREGVDRGNACCCCEDECLLLVEVDPQRSPEFLKPVDKPREVFMGEADGRVVHDRSRVCLTSLSIVVCVARLESFCCPLPLFVVECGGEGF